MIVHIHMIQVSCWLSQLHATQYLLNSNFKAGPTCTVQCTPIKYRLKIASRLTSHQYEFTLNKISSQFKLFPWEVLMSPVDDQATTNMSCSQYSALVHNLQIPKMGSHFSPLEVLRRPSLVSPVDNQLTPGSSVIVASFSSTLKAYISVLFPVCVIDVQLCIVLASALPLR